LVRKHFPKEYNSFRAENAAPFGLSQWQHYIYADSKKRLPIGWFTPVANTSAVLLPSFEDLPERRAFWGLEKKCQCILLSWMRCSQSPPLELTGLIKMKPMSFALHKYFTLSFCRLKF
jgi:hypothetical protein